MIRPGEIQIIARAAGVRDQQVEKDYIISWILKGLGQHKILSKAIVFKGGTALKKFYYEDYRFSEDIDFTLLDKGISDDDILLGFKDVFEFIKEEANIPLEIIEKNEHEDGGLYFYIKYVGPLGGQGINKKIKVDVAVNEKLEFDALEKGAIKVYSDTGDYKILCYSLEEILIEKLRSVMQRMIARDFYDIWYLLKEHGMDASFYLNEFKNKCIIKGLDPSKFREKLAERVPQYRGKWKYSLKDQIKDLPDFEKIERDVQRHVKKLRF